MCGSRGDREWQGVRTNTPENHEAKVFLRNIGMDPSREAIGPPLASRERPERRTLVTKTLSSPQTEFSGPRHVNTSISKHT